MIRMATPDDLERLVEMGMRFLTETSYRDVVSAKADRIGETVKGIAANPDGMILVADKDGQAVGMIAMMVYAHPFSGTRTAFEIAWWIEPEARGNGAGVRLLRAAEDWAREQGAEAMQMVAPNVEVGAMYQRLGYRPIETSFQRSL